MNTKVKIIFRVSLIFIILLICFLIIRLYMSSIVHQVAFIYDDKIYDDSLIYPSHIFVISNNYDGELSLETINKSINYFCSTFVPKLFEQFKYVHSESELKSFFYKKEKDIRLISGIDDENEFVELVEAITQSDNSNYILKRIEMNTEEYGWSGAQFNCSFVAYYEGDIELSIYVTIEEDIINKKVSPIHYSLNK